MHIYTETYIHTFSGRNSWKKQKHVHPALWIWKQIEMRPREVKSIHPYIHAYIHWNMHIHFFYSRRNSWRAKQNKNTKVHSALRIWKQLEREAKRGQTHPSIHTYIHTHIYIHTWSRTVMNILVSVSTSFKSLRDVHSPHTNTQALNPKSTGSRRVSEPSTMTTYEIVNKETPQQYRVDTGTRRVRARWRVWIRQQRVSFFTACYRKNLKVALDN